LQALSLSEGPGIDCGAQLDQGLIKRMNMSAATPEHILKLGVGFWASKTLLSAVELGVFSALAEAPAGLAALQKKLGLHPRSARDFFDALVALKLLDRQDGFYRNTAEADLFLDRAKPSYIGGFLEMLNGRLYGFWGTYILDIGRVLTYIQINRLGTYHVR
jgi:hypothetical protein